MKLRLSENWEVIEGFDGDCYLLNLGNGDWREISQIEAEALRLSDGEKTVKEVVDAIRRKFSDHKLSEDTFKSLFEDCLKKGELRKVSGWRRFLG